MSICVLYDADERNRPLMDENFARMTDLFCGRADVISIIHSDSSSQRSDRPAIYLSTGDIFDSFVHRKGRKIIPGNQDLKMIAAAERLARYDHFIRIEYDVWHNNPSPKMMDDLCEIATSGAFAATHTRSRRPSDTWTWWDSLTPPEDRGLPDLQMAAFLPLMTFSRAYIDNYRTYIEAGWNGHQEVLMPTIAAMLGIPIIELANYNVLVKADFSAHAKHRPATPTGAFFHPVKRIEDLPDFGSTT
jgi:hypothetical protein